MASVVQKEPVQAPIEFQNPAQPGLISVVIACGYDPDGLEITLSSLQNIVKDGFEFEVLVGNDGDDEGVSNVCQSFGVREVKIVPNAGPAGARNNAMTQSYGEFIAFIDADMTANPNWLREAYACAQEADYVAGAIPIDPKTITGLPELYDSFLAFDIEDYMKRNHGVTANLMVRRSLIEQIGGLDTRFRSGEDLEFGKRAARQGARLKYCPRAIALHPARSYAEQAKKLRRVIDGHVQLTETFDNFYNEYRPTWKRILVCLFPPKKVSRRPLENTTTSQKMRLYMLRWWMRIQTGLHLARYKLGILKV